MVVVVVCAGDVIVVFGSTVGMMRTGFTPITSLESESEESEEEEEPEEEELSLCCWAFCSLCTST